MQQHGHRSPPILSQFLFITLDMFPYSILKFNCHPDRNIHTLIMHVGPQPGDLTAECGSLFIFIDCMNMGSAFKGVLEGK